MCFDTTPSLHWCHGFAIVWRFVFYSSFFLFGGAQKKNDLLGGYIYIPGTAGASNLVTLLNNNAVAQKEVSAFSQFWVYNGNNLTTNGRHCTTLFSDYFSLRPTYPPTHADQWLCRIPLFRLYFITTKKASLAYCQTAWRWTRRPARPTGFLAAPNCPQSASTPSSVASFSSRTHPVKSKSRPPREPSKAGAIRTHSGSWVSLTLSPL